MEKVSIIGLDLAKRSWSCDGLIKDPSSGIGKSGV